MDLDHLLKKRKKQGGFTLIELAVVVVILGALWMMASKLVSAGFTSSAKAKALEDSAKKTMDAWELIANSCGSTTSPATTPILTTASAANATQLLYSGDTTLLAPAYKGCYSTSGVRPLAENISKTGASWFIGGYAFDPSVATNFQLNGTSLEITINNVPMEIALPIYQKYIDKSAKAGGTDIQTSAGATVTTLSSAQIGFSSATAPMNIIFKSPQ